eukprot:Colp12_sorted_trinity150504_noHs@30989
MSTPEWIRHFTQCISWVTVLLATGLLGFSYYAFVFVLCLDNIENTTQRVLYLVPQHIFFILLMIAYWRTILTPPGNTPCDFPSSDSLNDQTSLNYGIVTRRPDGGIRFCHKCMKVKPDRAHHCSICGQCILKMDHHCPWVRNCVGFRNYKFFVLFLLYLSIYLIMISAMTFPYFIDFFNGSLKDGGVIIIIMFFLAAVFAFSVSGLCIFHISLVCRNCTTIESMTLPQMAIRTKHKNGFSLGVLENVKQVFGPSPWLWLLPVYTSVGDGVRYATCGAGGDIESGQAEEVSLLRPDSTINDSPDH